MQTVITCYKNLTRWDVKSFLLQTLSGPQHQRLGDILQRKQIGRTANNSAPMLSLHFGGSFTERETNHIKGNLFVANSGDLVYSKIDLRNGAIGIIPQKYNEALFTAEFPIYEIDTKLINPVYLQLFLQSIGFKNLINSIVSGASGRKRVRPSDFENLYIYVPSFTVQEDIVERWQRAQKEAQELNKKAEEKEKAIDDYILRELGVAKKEYEKKKGVFVAWFKDLERWDTYFYREDFFDLNKQLEKINFGYLGEKAVFVSRPWNKNNFPTGIFRYVQISDVNKQNGIYNSENVFVNEAPSRATQIIKQGDILISTTRPYLAAFAKVDDSFDGCVASSGFSVIEKTTKDLDRDYLLEFLKSYAGLKQLEQRMTGASYPAITQEELEKIKIPLPPLSKQKEIAKKVETIRAEIAEIKNKASGILETTQKEIGKMLKA